MKEVEEQLQWLRVLMHYSDGVLPVGAYAHSMGLEGLVQLGTIHDHQTLRQFLLNDVLDALEHMDLPLIACAWQACREGDRERLMELDQLSVALRPARQLREAVSKIGRQQWKIYRDTWDRGSSDWDDFSWKFSQSPVVLGLIFEREGVPLHGALWSIAYQTFSALLQSALKLLPVGPRANQLLLKEALAASSGIIANAKGVRTEQIGTSNPLWDIAAMQHTYSKARMFLS